jgi:hypothetical protein
VQRFIRQHPDAVRRNHLFDTNRGSKTAEQLLTALFEDGAIRATIALDPQHHLLEQQFGKHVLIALTDRGTRSLFAEIVKPLPLTIEYVDTLTNWIRDTTPEPFATSHAILRKWFLHGFGNSAFHANVRVALWPAVRCNHFPAVLLPPAESRFSQRSTAEQPEYEWIRDATLAVNVHSDLAQEIILLAEGERDQSLPPNGRPSEHLPIAIHHLASLFAIARFSVAYQHYLWARMLQLVTEFRKKDNEIKDLREQLAERESESVLISALKGEVTCLKENVRLKETELQETKQELNRLLQGIGWPPSGVGV